MIGVNVSKELHESKINAILEEGKKELLSEIIECAREINNGYNYEFEPGRVDIFVDKLIRAVRVYDYKTR